MRNYPGMTDEQREKVANELSRVLADTYTLYFKTHAFHWNVKGARFYGLHNLFEEQYREMWEAVDELAERIVALGHDAPVAFAQLLRQTTLTEQTGIPQADDMIRELSEGHEAVTLSLRNALEVAQESKDEATASLIGERLVAHEKAAWMLSTMAN